MAEPLTQRQFDEFDAVRKPGRSADANIAHNAALAELATRAFPRLRELAQRLLRLEMARAFARYLDGFEGEDWPEEAEFMLWTGVTGVPKLITAEEAADFRTLAIEAGGWWARTDNQEPPSFMGTKEWEQHYRDWVRRSARKM